MTNNLKQFLEADALLPCPFCGSSAEQFAGDTYCTGRQCAAIIQGATKACSGGRWNTRAPDRNLLAAFEQVCVALERAEQDVLNDHSETVGRIRDALTAAAQYRKLMGGV